MPLLNIKQRKEYQKKYRLKNIDIIRAKDREYKKIQRLKFPEKNKEIKRKSYYKNREKCIERSKLYYNKNLEQIKLYQIHYRTINRDKLKQKELEYRIKHRKIICIRQYKYRNRKRKTDPYFKLLDNLRNRIYCVLKGKIKKSTRTLTLLGVKNISQVKLHLELGSAKQAASSI